MKRFVAIFAGLVFAASLGAQTPAPQTPTKAPEPVKTKELTVQSSISEDALVATYQDLTDNRKKANDILQQARATLDAKNKPIQAQIDPLAKQIDANNQEANKNYQTAVQPFSSNVSRDQAQIDAISRLVKKEQNLPDNATFDLETGKWVIPDTPKK